MYRKLKVGLSGLASPLASRSLQTIDFLKIMIMMGSGKIFAVLNQIFKTYQVFFGNNSIFSAELNFQRFNLIFQIFNFMQQVVYFVILFSLGNLLADSCRRGLFFLFGFGRWLNKLLLGCLFTKTKLVTPAETFLYKNEKESI